MENCLNQFTIKKALKHLKSSDDIISWLIDKHGPCTIKPSLDNLFRSLVISIIGQQLSANSAKAIRSRLFKVVDDDQFNPEMLLTLTDGAFQDIGLSQAKVNYIRGLSSAIINGKIDFKFIKKCNDDEVISKLCELKGIGRWTAEMFLIFGLGRPDVLSINDAGLKRGFKFAYQLQNVPSADEMITISNSWRPYRSIASWYIWRTLD